MEINNWSNKEIIKLLTARAGITQKKLSELLYNSKEVVRAFV